MRVFAAIWAYFSYQVRHTAIYVEMRKLLISQAFDPGTKIFVPSMTYEADYPLRGH